MTPTDICNQSLGIIGHDPIVSLDETDPSSGEFTDASSDANKCRIFYDTERDATFRDHHWNFAIRRKTLAIDPTQAPLNEFDHAYPRDVDDLRVISINDDIDASWHVEGRNLVTDETAVVVKYIHRIADPTEWDPLFINAFVLRLAAKLALSIAHEVELSDGLMKQYRAVIEEAKATDGQEGTLEPYEVLDLITVRRS